MRRIRHGAAITILGSALLVAAGPAFAMPTPGRPSAIVTTLPTVASGPLDTTATTLTLTHDVVPSECAVVGEVCASSGPTVPTTTAPSDGPKTTEPSRPSTTQSDGPSGPDDGRPPTTRSTTPRVRAPSPVAPSVSTPSVPTASTPTASIQPHLDRAVGSPTTVAGARAPLAVALGPAPAAPAASGTRPQGATRLPDAVVSSPIGSGPLRAATRLSIPIVLGLIVLVYLVFQTQLGKREPKLAQAPAHRDHDSLPFT